MERLTKTDGNYCRDICGQALTCPRLKANNSPCGDARRYEKLRQYEDTGYPPGELNGLLNMSNEPLAVDELRQMEGEPVWINAPDIPNRNGWTIVEGFEGDVMYIPYSEINLGAYGKTWQAYRHRPEEAVGSNLNDCHQPPSKSTDAAIEAIWNLFSDVPMNPETECIEERFMGFPAGTHREEIWHFFDQQHSKGVHYLLYSYQPAPAL